MKKIICFLILIIFIISCKSVKKVEALNVAISKIDTAQSIEVKKNIAVDSVTLIKGMLNKVIQQKINFETFNAKIKVEYYGQENSDKYTIYLSMKKDSVIYLKIAGSVLGISAVGLEAIITKDSVVIHKKVGEKYIQKRAISYLQDVTQIPFTFTTLQDLLVGNPIFIDTANIVSYRVTNNNQVLVQTVDEVFKNLITINHDNLLVTHSKLDDVDYLRSRTCDITYSNFAPVSNFQFSTYRNISVAEKSKLDVNLEFKEYTFNQPLKYAFTLPQKLKK
ncbi:MAG: DUF4292 domain-containing protein [Bacteroidetes bacterium]|nr:DUF4292 domain-containing protein [Bacteroidota bacterium]